MYTIKSDLVKNRLYLVIKGESDAADARWAEDEIVRHLDYLYPNFDVVTDIGEAMHIDDAARMGVGVIMAQLQSAGMRQAVQVVESRIPTISSALFDKTARKIGFTAKRAPSVKAADTFLDKARRAEAAPLVRINPGKHVDKNRTDLA